MQVRIGDGFATRLASDPKSPFVASGRHVRGVLILRDNLPPEMTPASVPAGTCGNLDIIFSPFSVYRQLFTP